MHICTYLILSTKSLKYIRYDFKLGVCRVKYLKHLYIFFYINFKAIIHIANLLTEF
jgi:hypothetical protein